MKDFPPYSESLALKELGFDEPCTSLYLIKDVRGLGVTGDFKILDYYVMNSKFTVDTLITRPTFSQAFRFFREKYKFIQEIRNWDGTENQWYYQIHNEEGEILPWRWIENKTHEEAELDCLRELIEIAKSQPA